MKLQKNIWIDKFVCLRSKMYAFICADDYKIKLKGVSKSYFKKIRFAEYKKCLDDKKYQQECDNYITRWLHRERYLQRVKNLHFSFLVTKDVMKIILEVNLGIKTIEWL